VKVLFVSLGVAIAGLSALAVLTLSEQRSDVPVMYWTTDANPARARQIATFEEWMVKKGYGGVNLKLDTNNTGPMKVIIQSASGVGSEIIDVYGGAQLRQYVSAGVLLDVTDLAKEYGFGLDKTYQGAREELVVDGRQYAFPCNVTAEALTINRAVLERENLPPLKFDPNWGEFLDWCLKVRKVDGSGRVTRFAVWAGYGFNPQNLWPTNGGSVFNETMTRCILDSPQVLEATRFYYDLMFKYKVIPTPVDIAATAAEAGYAGSGLQALGNGDVLAVSIGRYGLIQLRRFKDFKPDVALIPYKVTPMMFIFSRAAGINAGAKNPALAARFQQFLADEPYNRLIIKDADALPPNPKMAATPEFLEPVEFPGEHGAHGKYLRAAAEFGVGREYSRFISPPIVNRIIDKYLSGIASEVLSVDDGVRQMTDEINLELKRSVQRDPKLASAYKEACELQAEIDAMKRQGKPVPPSMISNPVLRRLRERQE
jgi:multiple sugar transport system substrate-binding protein